MAEYRASGSLEAAANLARKQLREIDDFAYMLADDDPLRRAFNVARTALLLGLWSSPVAIIDQPALCDAELPHGPDALSRVDAVAKPTEEALQGLFEHARGLPAGRARRRKYLMNALVRAAQHLHAVLLGETTQGVFLRAGTTAAQLACELEKLCATSDVRDGADADALPSFLFAFAADVARDFKLAFGTCDDVVAVMNAIVGLVQEDERARRAGRSALPGRRPGPGNRNHLDAIHDLLVAVGETSPAQEGDDEARGKMAETIGKDLLAARKAIGKLKIPNASAQSAGVPQAHEDPTSSGRADRGRSGAAS